MENYNIPGDIMMDILTRLPAKSLMAFRCVCKPWRDLFRNPEFITKHHLKQTSLSKDKGCFLVKHGVQRDNCFSFLCTVTDGGGGGENEMLALTENISIPFTDNFLFNSQVLGPCNGLLCISDSDKNLLWNPAIREFKPLPLSPLERPPGAEFTMFGCVGFGFDRKSNDYKFLRFVTNYFDEGMSSVDQVELYSLKSDSWREIPSVDVLPGGIPCFYPYTTDGVYYWWASGGPGALILSFDFADEVFGKLPLPDFGVSWSDYIPELSIFNGLFAVIVYASRAPERWFDIWVMTERGVKESWVREVSIGPILGVKRPLAFWKNGALFLEDPEGQVVLYDPSTKELKNLQLHGNKDRVQVIEYVESLVPLNGSREEDGDEPFIRTRIRNLSKLQRLATPYE